MFVLKGISTDLQLKPFHYNLSQFVKHGFYKGFFILTIINLKINSETQTMHACLKVVKKLTGILKV